MALALKEYRYTPPKLEDTIEPRRQMLADWTDAWTRQIASEIGGLDATGYWRVGMVVHEIRKRVEAGDYSHPERLPMPTTASFLDNE